MLKTKISQIKKFKNFLGREVWLLFLISLAIGVMWFFVETAFIFVLQGLLSALGILDTSQAFLPSFYPKDQISALVYLLLYGLFRAIVVFCKQYFSEITSQAFVRIQRGKILDYALSNTSEISTPVTLNAYTEKVSQSAGVIQLLTLLINSLVASTLLLLLGLKLAPLELIIGLVLLAIIYFPFNFLNKKISEYSHGQIAAANTVYEVMLLGLKNHLMLKIYNLTEREIKKGKDAIKGYEYFFKRYLFMSSLKTSFPQFAGLVVISILCYVSLEYIKTPGVKLLSFIYIFNLH